MTIASSMKELTQDIASSHEGRARAIEGIRQEAERSALEARSLVRDFNTSRTQATAQLRRDLAQTRASRTSDVEKLRHGFRKMVADFGGSRRETEQKLRKDLIEGRAEIRAAVGEMQDRFRVAQSETREDINQARNAWRGLVSMIGTDKTETPTESSRGTPKESSRRRKGAKGRQDSTPLDKE